MNEIELNFHKENREKKNIGHSAYKKSGGRRGKCRMPSDYLTKKQKEGLNSKVESVTLNKPLSWSEFISLNKNLQKEYMKNLIEKYGARQSDMAEMFSIDRSNLCRWLKREHPDIIFSRNRSKYVDRRWETFVNNAKEPTAVELLTKTHDWSKHDNEPKKDVDPVEAIREEAKALGIEFVPKPPITIAEGSITFRGMPAQIFNKIAYILDTKKPHEISISFKEIDMST